MSDELKSTRGMLLDSLLRHKAGLTIDELSTMLSVSRNAVRQHLTALELDGQVSPGEMRRSVGRPSTVYTLSRKGTEQFPRQYSMLSGLLLTALRNLHGQTAIRTVLQKVAEEMSAQPAMQVIDQALSDRAVTVAQLMTDLGYVAAAETVEGTVEISALNCIYHHLAAEFPEVCEFDVDLIQRLSDAHVEHAECMVRGGRSCRFRLTPNVQ